MKPQQIATRDWRKKMKQGEAYLFVPCRGYIRALQGVANCQRKLKLWEDAYNTYMQLEQLNGVKFDEFHEDHPTFIKYD